MMLEEVGVRYTRDANAVEVLSYEFQRYSYEWQSPNGEQGTSFVFVRRFSDLLRLLNHWNRSDYKYTASEQV